MTLDEREALEARVHELEDLVSAEGDADRRIAILVAAEIELRAPRPIDDWDEDDGPVLWWTFPIEEAPYVGSPLDDDFPEYVTHWTKIPFPVQP